ncbi:MAG: T9SS type A sorting domain-containing protein [Flavobacteriales bacterium]|jgi:hypothetical protein
MKKIITTIALCCLAILSFTQCENPPIPTVVYTTNSCGQPGCFYVTVSGGTAPFSFIIPFGPELNPNNYACWDIPGNYELFVTDAEGCVGQTTLSIVSTMSTNDICETSVTLTNGEQISGTLCSLNFENPVCTNLQFSQTGWYTFNSEDFTHIQFGAFSQFASSPGIIQGMGIQILAAENNGACADAVEVYCGNITSCFSFEENFTVTPQTNYYVRVMAAWTSWININVGVVMSNEPITGVCGCTNPLSCNYDPEAIINDGSCGTNGCTDASACNYMSWATCDDGSCLFGNDITGVFFNDINGNGVRDGWPILEPALSSAGYITIDELNITIYPDATGSFVLPGLELGSYSVTFHNTAGNWVLTGGDNTQTITLPTCNGLPIGLTPTSGVAAQISGTNMFSTSLIQCNNGFYPGAYISNTGTVPISGTFTITANPLFTAQTVSYGEPFTNPAPGVFEWQIENMLPGAYLNLIAHVNGPGVDYVGQSFPFTFDLELSDGTQIFYSNTWTTNALVSCAYDPNDKQATPEGYTENHFILEDTELQYKIRFQNTGNAPAFDVVIEDQIDIARLDLNTLEPLNASHSFSTIVQPDGLVKFVFNNIMLPDSTSNEPESHGYVIYKIRTMPGIEVGEVINNTAAIFFDDNPPIITNTTYHEIYDCSEIPQFNEEESECYGEEFNQLVDYPYIESIEWFVNGEFVSDEMMFSQLATFGDTWTVDMTITNPLCTVSSQWIVIEEPLPSYEIVYDPINQTLTASEGFMWQWYDENGDEIEGATEQTFGLENEGGYFVEITGGNGCSVISDMFSFVSINESKDTFISIFPNPVQNDLRINVSASLIGSNYFVYDITGREVLQGKITSIHNTIDFSAQSSGSYIIKVGNANVRVQK